MTGVEHDDIIHLENVAGADWSIRASKRIDVYGPYELDVEDIM